MAAVTPTSVKTISLGSASMKIATFSSVDNGDTYASGIDSIIKCWADVQATPTVSGSSSYPSFSAGTFTFNQDKASLPIQLNIIEGLQI